MRGLAKEIAETAFTRPLGHRCDSIRMRLDLLHWGGMNKPAVKTTMEISMLRLAELENPDAARAYYQRQIEAVPGQFAEDVAALDVIPPGYARVSKSVSNIAAGQIRKIHCNCDMPQYSYDLFYPFTPRDYFNCEETDNRGGFCRKCHSFQWYQVTEDVCIEPI